MLMPTLSVSAGGGGGAAVATAAAMAAAASPALPASRASAAAASAGSVGAASTTGGSSPKPNHPHPNAHPNAHHRRHHHHHVELSATSHEEWVPTSGWTHKPPFLAYDVGYTAAAMAATAAAVTWLVAGWRGLVGVVGAPASLPLPAAVAATAVGAALFAFLRLVLEPVSYAHMLAAEARLLATVAGEVRHHWTNFRTAHAAWRVHSLIMHGSAAAARARSAGAAPAADGTPTTAGAAATDAKPAVVFLHGHSAGAAHWEAIFDRMVEVADVYVLDVPGWGRSPCPPELLGAASPTVIADLHAEMLRGWLAANGLRRIVLVGHSFGGFHAIQFTRRFPAIVEQVILVSPAGLTPVMPEGSLAWGALFRFAPPQWVARTFGRLGFLVFKTLYLAFTTEDRRFPDFYYQLAAQTACTGAGDAVAARFLRFAPSGGLWWSHPCLTDVMAIDVPLSVMWGQRDDMLPPIVGALLHRIRPHTDLYLIKDALHNPAHNNVRAFCDAIIDAVLKYRCRPRVTAEGRGSGQEHADGTADELLEPAAHASGTATPTAGRLAMPPPVPLSRCVSAPAAPRVPVSPLVVPPAAVACGATAANAAAPAPAPAAPVISDSDSETEEIGTHGVRGSGSGDFDSGHLSDGMSSSEGGSAASTPEVEPVRHVAAAPAAAAPTATAAASTGSPAGLRRRRGARLRALGSLSPTSARSTASSTLSRTSASSDQLLAELPGHATPSTVDRVVRDAVAAAASAGGAGDSDSSDSDVTTPLLAPPPQAARHPTLSPVLEALAGSEAPPSPALSAAAPLSSRGVAAGGGGGGSGSAWRGHDGITTEFGVGRGYCRGCMRAVLLHKSYWRCACAAWSFNAHVSDAITREHFRALLRFLDELYVTAEFDARTSTTIIMYLRVRTPLPLPAAGAGGSGGVASAAPDGRKADASPAATAVAALLRSRAPSSVAPPPPPAPPLHSPLPRTGEGSSGIIFTHAPLTFPRGDAFLLD